MNEISTKSAALFVALCDIAQPADKTAAFAEHMFVRFGSYTVVLNRRGNVRLMHERGMEAKPPTITIAEWPNVAAFCAAYGVNRTPQLDFPPITDPFPTNPT